MPAVRPRRLSALLLVAGLLTAATTLPTPAAAEEAAPPTLTLDRSVITAGEQATASGTAAPGQTVELFGGSRPDTSFVLLGSTVTDAAGAFGFTVAPTTNSRYFVRTPDGEPGGGARLLVRRDVVLESVRQPAGDQLVLQGTVFPAPVGTPLRVIFERDGVRTLEAQGRALSGNRFQVRLTSTRRGAFAVSVLAPTTLDNAEGESEQVRVVLVPGQADPHQAP